MMSFLVEDSPERSSIRDLLELGHSLIAEINRLSEMVPEDFLNPSASRFKPLIVDFAYFGDLTAIDKFIDTHEPLYKADLFDFGVILFIGMMNFIILLQVPHHEHGALLEDEFFFSFDKVIKCFGALFDSLANFFSDVVELSVRHSSHYQSAFRPSEADLQQRQIKAEILYVTGIILIIFDEKIPLSVKQRLFIAHYRSNPASNERFDLLVDLMKTKPTNMEQLFNSLPVNKHFANSVVTSVRSDGLFMDEFQQEILEENIYESRITKTQRSVLFICLCFTPSVLHSDFTTMRQIVDMYFAEHWVISLHLGVLINVVSAWEVFKAASAALQQAVSVVSAKKLSVLNASSLKAIVFPHPAKISSADFAHCHKLIATANLRLRWIILHSFKNLKVSKRSNQLCDAVWSQMGMSSADLFKTLLQISNFEYNFKDYYRNYLSKKVTKFNELKKDNCQLISQMAALFSNDMPLQRIKKNVKLHEWLLLVEKMLTELDVSNSDAISVVEHLKKRIEQARFLVSDIHDLSGNVAVDQYLQSISVLMSELSYCCTLSEEHLSRVEAASEFSYGWTLIDQWSSEMEALVENDPLSIRSLFVKLSSSIGRMLTAVENPSRITSISLCYSRQLEDRLRKILQVVPRSLFTLLDKIASLLDTSLKSCVLKTDLRHFADSERRLNLAANTYIISTLSLGITTMQLTWIGSLRIDLSALLLDGIKRELVSRISSCIYNELSAASDINVILNALKPLFRRFREAFTYICEHMSINGALVWQSEMTRVIGYMLERESNLFIKRAISDEESLYQSKSVVLPRTPKIGGSITSLGRFYDLYSKFSDPRTTRYVYSLQVWCDVKTKKTLLSQESFCAAQDALSPMFLMALDKITCFHIVKYMNTFCELYANFITGPILQSFMELVSCEEIQPAARFKIFEIASNRISPVSSSFAVIISRIGQNQFLRQRILSAIRSNVYRNSFIIANAIDNFQKSVLHDLRNRCEGCSDVLLTELAELLQQCAITNPFQKRYIKKECLVMLPTMLFVLLLAAAPLISNVKRSDSLDVSMFAAGVSCLLIQFDVTETFLTCARTYFSSGIIPAQVKPTYVIIPALRLIADLCTLEPQDFEKYVPASVWEQK